MPASGRGDMPEAIASEGESIVERYDRDAEDYERYWAPVLDASARGLLDRLPASISSRSGGPPAIVDVGTGSGVLALEVRRRWPPALITGVDPSLGMLAMAARRAAAAGVPADDPRLRWLEGRRGGPARRRHSADLVISSFVLQLVPDRPAALREAHRVLRPGRHPGRADVAGGRRGVPALDRIR